MAGNLPSDLVLLTLQGGRSEVIRVERVVSCSAVPAKVPGLSGGVSLSFDLNVFGLRRGIERERLGVHSRVGYEGRPGLGEDGEEGDEDELNGDSRFGEHL
jgi:hypothetical protein